jgi:hypothetical protein
MTKQRTEKSSEIDRPSFLLAGWIHKVTNPERRCQTCESNPARFVLESYGYEGIEADDERIEAMVENGLATLETIREDIALMIHKSYEAQCRGIYQIVGRISLCGLCVAELADGHLEMDHAGALTVTQLVSSSGTLSCLIGWHVPSRNETPRVPMLIYIQAQTIDDVLSFVKSPHGFLHEKEEC